MELPIHLSKDTREPIYHQVENQLKALIAGGQLTAGTPLPSIRALSKDLEISIITTRKAYQNLEQQGFIRTTQGKGTFVADIADDKKHQVKISSVYQTIEHAVDTALQYDYSLEQIKEIFHEIIDNHREKGE
ncbi:GntR family transcriptional regulator [Lentibacillus sp. L22]|uniref:GntR family transcriptional regulator n=1 Tax=Lentibacillus sp. L22 TaxID=3163028 RepID=UPI003464F1B1